MDLLKKNLLFLVVVFVLLQLITPVWAADELFIITTRDGSTIVAKEYRFTEERIEFTTENGLPGFIKKEELAQIANMIGVPPGEVAEDLPQISMDERNRKFMLLGAAVLAVLFAIIMVYLSGRRKKGGAAGAEIFYGRREKDPTTEGHLSFEYKGSLGRVSTLTLEVRRAYEEDSVLYVEGFCTSTGKRKKIRADRVVGPVTDMSSDDHAPMENFFVDAKGQE